MTNEFAIKVLAELRGYGDSFANIGFDRKEALDMAIKALEQEPCEEYRKGWYDAITTALKETHNYYTEDGVFKAIQEETLVGVGMSMQEPKTDGDYISRHEVIKIIENKLNPCTDMFKCLEMSEIKDDVEHLPSVTPKTEWISVSERLPEDGQNVLFCDIDGDIMIGYHVKGRPDTHFSQDGSWDDIKNVRAWMPLPTPYEESEAKE